MKALVVCPTYGRIPFLNRMLASFLSQTYDDKTLVIVNDDKNITLFCEYKNVICINLSERILLPQKRNLGSAINYSDIILHLDDDDIFLPRRIQNHVNKHFHNPDINMYFNDISYTIYGDEFSTCRSGPSSNSHLRKAWHEVGGYYFHHNQGEDTEYFDNMPKVLVETNKKEIDYVYNYGGINYHTSGTDPKDLEGIAYNQLKDMNILGKKYFIEPDYYEFNQFIKLVDIYKETKNPVKIIHTGLGKIEIV